MSKPRKYHLLKLLSITMACILLTSCSFRKAKEKTEEVPELPQNVQEPLDISPTAETANLELASLVDSFVYGPILEGGILTESSIVQNIRMGNHDGFERIVIEFDHEEIVPKYKASYYRCPDSAILHMEGTGQFVANAPKTDKSKLVESVYPVATFDESSHRLGMVFRKPVTVSVFEMQNPARIVMDIKEDINVVKDGLPEAVYALRSGPYDDLEIVGYVEQDLAYAENGKNVRIIYQNNKNYLVEEGIYSSKGDCEKRKKALENKNKNYSMYIEEIPYNIKNDKAD